MRRRGQVLVMSVLSIILILLTISSLLISTSLMGMNMPKTQFRETATQIAFGSRGAMAMALADISKRLNREAEMNSSIVELEDWPEAKNGGLELITKWQNDTVRNFPATGLNLSFVPPEFYCNWNDTLRTGNYSKAFGYSKAAANVSIDLLNYGFRGYTENILIEFNATLEGFNDTTSFHNLDGRGAAFKMNFVREKGYPLNQIDKGLVKVFFEIYDRSENDRFLNETLVKYVKPESEGDHTIFYLTEMNTITSNLNDINSTLDTIDDLDEGEKDILRGYINETKQNYNDHDRKEAWFTLLYDLRPKLNYTSGESMVEPTTNTSAILRRIDVTLSQLRPRVRIVARDFRGITVSVYGELDEPVDEGPKIYKAKAQPNPCILGENVALSATADDSTTGNSTISEVEYFIQDNEPEAAQYGNGAEMLPVDLAFDWLIEAVEATINGDELNLGENYVWIHARDSNGLWGDFRWVKVIVQQEGGALTIDDLYMWGYSYGFLDLWQKVTARVTIINNETGNPIEGALVQGFWGGDASGEVEGTTLQDGTYDFIYYRIGWWTRTYIFTVDTVSKDDYIWDGVPASETISGPPWT